MRYLICFVMFTVAGAMFLVACYAADFNADIVTVSPEGSFTAKIYVSGDKSRTEVEGTASIARNDKKVVWVLIPVQNMYMEQPFDPRTAASTKEKMEGEVERIVEGHETVSGRPTTKYRVVYETQGRHESIFQWIDEGAHIPVKTAAVDGSWSSEFRNISTGPQNPELFEIPAGYNKMSIQMPDMNQVIDNE